VAAKVEIVTSDLTQKEIERLQGQWSKSIQREYRLLGKVNFLEDHTVLGFHTEPSFGKSSPLVEKEANLGRTD
jgi:hypothetical protein